MCHIDFHMINTTVQNYFLDQDYFAFCSTTEKGKKDTKNSESKVQHNDYQERFLYAAVPHKRQRDRAEWRKHHNKKVTKIN